MNVYFLVTNSFSQHTLFVAMLVLALGRLSCCQEQPLNNNYAYNLNLLIYMCLFRDNPPFAKSLSV